MDKRKVVLTTGTHYSGTSLLSAMLNAHSLGFSGNELNSIGFTLNNRYAKTMVMCSCSLERDKICDFWKSIITSLHEERSTGLYRKLFDVLACEFLVDASKPLDLISQYASGLSPSTHDMVMFHMTKSPERYIASCIKKFGLCDIDKWIDDWWEINYERQRFAEEVNIPRFIIKYEDLAKMPELTLRNVCSLLGVKYEEGMLEFWNAPIAHLLCGNDGVQVFFKERNFNVKASQILKEKPEYSEHFREIFYLPDEWKEHIDKETFDKIWDDHGVRKMAQRLDYEKPNY